MTIQSHKTFTLITGASDGLGAAFARLLANEGHNLILVARRGDKLKALAQEIGGDVTVHIIIQDLAEHGAAGKVYAKVRRLKAHVDQLINNAGSGDYAVFAHSKLERQENMVNLNITTLIALTHLFLPEMTRQKHGRVLNVASMAAFMPLPHMSIYGATKSFVLSFSQSLSEELRGSGVTVTCLCPGVFKSGFSHAAGAGGRSSIARGRTPAQAIAAFGYHAMQEGVAVAIPGTRNKLLANVIFRLSPRAWIRRAMAWMWLP